MIIEPHTLAIIGPLVVMTAASPGPDVLYITSHALSGQWQRGLAAWSGICLGIIIYALAAAFGLSAIFSLAPTLYYIIKWMGVAYLGYIGFSYMKSALSTQKREMPGKHDKQTSLTKLFTKGLYVTLLNPKTTLFFTAFLPQFVDPSLPHIPLQLLLLGFFSITIGQAVYILYVAIFVYLGRKFNRQLNLKSRLAQWADGLCGALYLAFATGLALWKRT